MEAEEQEKMVEFLLQCGADLSLLESFDWNAEEKWLYQVYKMRKLIYYILSLKFCDFIILYDLLSISEKIS